MNKDQEEIVNRIIQAYDLTKEIRAKRYQEKQKERDIPDYVVQLQIIGDTTEHFTKSIITMNLIEEAIGEITGSNHLLPKMSPEEIMQMYTHYIEKVLFIVVKEKPTDVQDNPDHSRKLN